LKPPHKADIVLMLTNVRCWGFGAHILILRAFSALSHCYPHAYPLAEFARQRIAANIAKLPELITG
jgi:hypothetical protein